MTPARRPAIVGLLPLALVVFAAAALASRWWLSALAAPLVAWLLWRGHRRARFTAYVFLSVVLVRGVVSGQWAASTFAALCLLALQGRPARDAWPRLRW